MNECPDCSGLGVIPVTNGVGLPAVWKQCHHVLEAKTQARLSRARIPKIYADLDFKVGPKPAMKFLKEGGSALISGGRNKGKTSLAVAALRRAVTAGAEGRFFDCLDFFSAARRSFQESGDTGEYGFWDSLKSIDIVVVDDVLSTRGRLTDYEANCLYRLANTRMRAQKDLILTFAGGADEQRIIKDIGENFLYRAKSFCKEVKL